MTALGIAIAVAIVAIICFEDRKARNESAERCAVLVEKHRREKK